MALPDKLPRDPMYKTYEMTEADWEEYFECRKKYDVEYTKSEEIYQIRRRCVDGSSYFIFKRRK